MVGSSSEPVLLVDEEICRDNIRAMLEKSTRNRCAFRPHFKTHDNLPVGRWFRELGISAITVSSLKMAQKFADDGWNDIFIAMPVDVNQLPQIEELARAISLTVLIESPAVVVAMGNSVHHALNVRIEIDAGYQRTGIKWNDLGRIDECVELVNSFEHFHFSGFSAHAGNSYYAADTTEVAKVHLEHEQRLAPLKSKYQTDISIGDTPSCSMMEDFFWADEIRAGNFVFYDLMQCALGSCKLGQVSVRVQCPVIAVYPERNQLVVHGGAIHFSKESILWEGKGIFGKLDGSTWGLEEAGSLCSLSQEHGILQVTDEVIGRVSVGDILKIIPVHSCLVANLIPLWTTQEKLLV